jgi:hypothetical protein
MSGRRSLLASRPRLSGSGATASIPATANALSLRTTLQLSKTSMVSVNRTKIAVPHPYFSVHIFNETTQDFELGESAAICESETDCWLHAKHEVLGHSLNFMLV